MASFIMAYLLCMLLGAVIALSFEPEIKKQKLWLRLPVYFGIGAATLMFIHQMVRLFLV